MKIYCCHSSDSPIPYSVYTVFATTGSSKGVIAGVIAISAGKVQYRRTELLTSSHYHSYLTCYVYRIAIFTH